MAALAGALAAAVLACQSNALQPLGGAGPGGRGGHPNARDAGAGDAAKPVGDASLDHLTADATPAPPGTACTGSRGCRSGFCVEGVCCASACTGGCQTCSAAGAVGTCLDRAWGAVPRDDTDCPLSAPASCGLDGTCDGAGACRLYLGNTCLAGVCANGAITGAFACDGQGVCKSGAPALICAPYICDPGTNSCAECQSDSQCSEGRQCQNGLCVVPNGGDPGGLCSRDSDCITGHCADGVCCSTACTDACVSCALPGRLGNCLPVPVGEPDSHSVCTDQGAPSCGHDGTCDGLGGCSLYLAGVTCAATSFCSGTLWSSAGRCDGAGTCQRQTIPCLPYACDPQTNTCHDFCATADDCAPGKPCVNGACGNPEPAACSSDAECASGFCAQGACCATKCDGPCFSCALPATIGTCMPVPNPPDGGACAP